VSEGPAARPAYYAARSGGWQDWWTLLHPPYTAWHLAYVVIGACLAPHVGLSALIATLLAFFLAVGVGAHALDELNRRPLRTTIPAKQLVAAAALGLGGAVALGVVGAVRVSPYLAAFIAVGLVVAVGYNLEPFGGRLHTRTVFVLSWGAFPVLTAYFAQHATLSLAAVAAAAFATLVVEIQQLLSTPARDLRRRVATVEGTLTRADGSVEEITKESMLRPLERSLKALCWMGVAVALAMVLRAYVG
jgi:hypothetical protein